MCTPLLLQIIKPILATGMQNRQLQKPILVIVITDGEPTGEPRNTVANVIKGAKNLCMGSQYGPGAITFEFAQVPAIWRLLLCTLRFWSTYACTLLALWQYSQIS